MRLRQPADIQTEKKLVKMRQPIENKLKKKVMYVAACHLSPRCRREASRCRQVQPGRQPYGLCSIAVVVVCCVIVFLFGCFAVRRPMGKGGWVGVCEVA